MHRRQFYYHSAYSVLVAEASSYIETMHASSRVVNSTTPGDKPT
jgi:hypothetical protein